MIHHKLGTKKKPLFNFSLYFSVQVDTNEELSEEEQVQIEKCLVFPLDAENEFSVGLYSEQKVNPPSHH